MKDIYIKTEGWHLNPDWAVAGTRGSFGCARLVFELSPEWEGLALRATFFPREGGAVSVIMTEPRVVIPREVYCYAGNAEFVLDGVSADNVRLISARGTLRVIDTAEPGGKLAGPPCVSEIEALRIAFAELRAEIEQIKHERKEG